MTAAAVGRATGQTTVMLLRNTEQLLDLGYEENVWVIDLIRVEFLHFCFCNEAALVPKSLLGQVLPTIVSNFLLGTSKVLFPQIFAYLEQHKGIFSSLHGQQTTTFITNFVRFILAILFFADAINVPSGIIVAYVGKRNALPRIRTRALKLTG